MRTRSMAAGLAAGSGLVIATGTKTQKPCAASTTPGLPMGVPKSGCSSSPGRPGAGWAREPIGGVRCTVRPAAFAAPSRVAPDSTAVSTPVAATSCSCRRASRSQSSRTRSITSASGRLAGGVMASTDTA